MNRHTRGDASAVADPLTEYLNAIGRYRMLSRNEERALGRRIRHGDHEAVNELVCANLRFVVAIAKPFRSRAVSLLDLIDEGNLGLMRAAQRFDERRGIKFISYAVWWIRQAILHALAQQSRIVRVPLRRTRSMIPPRGHVSLDAPRIPGEENSLLDYLPDTDTPLPDEATAQQSVTESIDDAVARLRPREAHVLRLYFGLNGAEPMTLEGIGALYGITRERVRQIRDRALRTLRATMSHLAPDGPAEPNDSTCEAAAVAPRRWLGRGRNGTRGVRRLAAPAALTRRRPGRAPLLKEHR